ncbi:MAG: response regulator [Piscinibacter sp.]|uniref:response regulator n=1 Tax=Piscinibacter sp. TaxID=1903157 RepID=UPI001B70EA8A|nr:response regulator [Piscinibacter sp.]MBP5991241.1 response regulator [Piscinibacter sp.]MBP6026546.1 response regulator [Piscinibacter sp.]
MSDAGFIDTFTVAIEGFSAFERQALASFFRLAARRSPAFRQVDEPGMADFLIADADHAASVAAVRRGQRVEDTVFIGAAAPEGAAAWLPRPIDPVHVMRALDELVELRLSAPEPPSAMMDLDPMEVDTLRGGLDDLPQRRAEPPAPAAEAAPEPAPAPAASRPRGGGGREVLLVEDSPIARQFLKQRLQHLGYRVIECASGEAALDLLSRRTFEMVFLDVVLGPPGSIDGLQLCQRLKQRGAQRAGLRTVVVMVTGLDGATDRVRGSLAGCDAYLTKPLHESEFIATLLQVDPAFEWQADTATAA